VPLWRTAPFRGGGSPFYWSLSSYLDGPFSLNIVRCLLCRGGDSEAFHSSFKQKTTQGRFQTMTLVWT